MGVAGQGEVCPGLGVLGIVVVPVAQEDGVHRPLLGPDLVQRLGHGGLVGVAVGVLRPPPGRCGRPPCSSMTYSLDRTVTP